MFVNMRLQTKYALAVASIGLLLMSCIGIFWTVSESLAQSKESEQLIDSENRQSQKSLDYQQAQLKVKNSLEIAATAAELKAEKKEKRDRVNEVKLAAEQAEKQRVAQVAAKANLEVTIRKFLGNEGSKVGIVFYDLSTGTMISINGDKKFTAASTIKLPLAMIIYDKVSTGARKEADTLKFSEKSREGGTGILQGKDLSSPIKISTLVEDCIKYSDNIAANMLITSMDFNQFKNEEDSKLGITTNHAANEITAFGAFNALKKLNDGANKGNKGYITIISLMKQTIFNDRISNNISNSIVAHKIGNYESNVHDIGIIYTKNPYILTVYTNGLRNPNATISGISDIIYAQQSGT